MVLGKSRLAGEDVAYISICMPGALGYGWHEGSRGEYLAQYFLTALGVSAPVIRQEDIGIDFYCALARNEDKKLTFHSPYIVQHGASDSKEFVYGGVKEKKGRSGEIEINGAMMRSSGSFPKSCRFLFAQLIKPKSHFRLYSTSAMWLLRYQFGREMTSIELCPERSSRSVRSIVLG